MVRSSKVLVVDDDPNLLLTVQAVLEDAGFEVITRATAFGTSQVVMSERPDIVLLDVDMPGLGGAGLVPLLSQLPRIKVALVLFSSLDRLELQALARECGAFGAIEKASSPRQLVEDLKTLLERWSRSHVRLET